jgi:hypothetical protein
MKEVQKQSRQVLRAHLGVYDVREAVKRTKMSCRSSFEFVQIGTHKNGIEETEKIKVSARPIWVHSDQGSRKSRG